MSLALFWGLLALMTLAALGVVLLPLLRHRAKPAVSRRQTNIAIYQERVREIEQGLQTGQSSPEEVAALRAELDSRLISDTADTGRPLDIKSSTRPQKVLLCALGAVIPALALSLYLFNSDWQLALAGNGPKAVELLLTRLERHLEQEPTDANGWQLLAQSYAGLRRFDDAAAAYARLNALAATPDGLIGEAENQALAADGNLQGRPATLIGQALRLEANHPRALWYSGLVAIQRADTAVALEHWQLLAKQDLPAEFRELLDAQVKRAGGKPLPAARKLEISVQVNLDPKLSAQVTPDMPVFIYARGEGQKGPPLAVVRRRVADLPLTLVLDDGLSMLPERKLSSVGRWTITARVALQGSAQTSSGDLLDEQTVTRQQLPKAVQLTINRVVP